MQEQMIRRAKKVALKQKRDFSFWQMVPENPAKISRKDVIVTQKRETRKAEPSLAYKWLMVEQEEIHPENPLSSAQQKKMMNPRSTSAFLLTTVIPISSQWFQPRCSCLIFSGVTSMQKPHEITMMKIPMTIQLFSPMKPAIMGLTRAKTPKEAMESWSQYSSSLPLKASIQHMTRMISKMEQKIWANRIYNPCAQQEQVSGKNMKQMPIPMPEYSISWWQFRYFTRSLVRNPPKMKPRARAQNMKVKLVSGSAYFSAMKGMTGPGIAITAPQMPKARKQSMK